MGETKKSSERRDEVWWKESDVRARGYEMGPQVHEGEKKTAGEMVHQYRRFSRIGKGTINLFRQYALINAVVKTFVASWRKAHDDRRMKPEGEEMMDGSINAMPFARFIYKKRLTHLPQGAGAIKPITGVIEL